MLVQEIIPTLLFSLIICSILGELVGISFEQVKFLVDSEISTSTLFQVHWLKLPAFVAIAIPFSMLMTTVMVYSRLSARQEIIALQSFGVSIYRLIIPCLAIACIAMIAVFMLQELIVPDYNFRAAIILEQEWDIDRTKLNKYNQQNIVFQEFETDRKHLKLLLFANSFKDNRLNGIVLIKYHQRKISQIIVARSATWNESLQQWHLASGIAHKLNAKGDYIQTEDFTHFPLKLNRNLVDYVSYYRDNREMKLLDLHRRLRLMKQTNDSKKIRELRISIQERYAIPTSCFTFALLGSVLGINFRKNNSLTIATVVIISYYFTQFISTSLAVTEAIPIFLGVWLPNLLSLVASCLIPRWKKQV